LTKAYLDQPRLLMFGLELFLTQMHAKLLLLCKVKQGAFTLSESLLTLVNSNLAVVLKPLLGLQRNLDGHTCGSWRRYRRILH